MKLSYEQIYYSVQTIYIVIQVVVKISIALMIARIFPVRWMQLTVKGFIVFMIAHNIIFVFLILFQCMPVASIWNKTITGKCIDITAVGYAGAALTIAEDLVLIGLPIPELLKLQVSLTRRIHLIVIFTLASL